MLSCNHSRFEYNERARRQECVRCHLSYDAWLDQRIRLLEASAYRMRQAPQPYEPRTEVK